MRVIGRLLVLLLGGMIAAAVAGTIAARQAQRRIVPIDDPEADEIRLAAIFAPVSFRSTATSFRGGSIDCWYGGGVIDLREATLDPAGARLEVRAVSAEVRSSSRRAGGLPLACSGSAGSATLARGSSGPRMRRT
jgi:hypothetical protein